MSEMNLSLFPRAPFLKPVATQSRNDALFRLNQSRLAMLGDSCAPSPDPCGQELRTLRISQNWNPSALATRSCLSLAQLYELEMGASSLFYSASLRLQAAKKVAALLGSDWEAIMAKHQAPTIPAAPAPHLDLATPPAPTEAVQPPASPKSKLRVVAVTLLLSMLIVGGSYITDQYLGYALPFGLTFDAPTSAPAPISFQVQF